MLQQINTHNGETRESIHDRDRAAPKNRRGMGNHNREQSQTIQSKEEQEEMTEIDRQQKQEEIQGMQHTAEGIQNKKGCMQTKNTLYPKKN
jgi:hypothetical protein